jgi:glycosyltransferase involved in cell wall biosynthesis
LDRSQLIPPFATDYIDTIVSSDDRLASDVASCRAAGLTSLIGLEQLDWQAISGIGQDRDRAPRAAMRCKGLLRDEACLFDSVMPAWNALLGQYNHRMMYGGSAVLGLLSDSPNYMAYEHGTIRSIPFNDDALGRLTRAAYEQADAVFLTNTDYVTAKQRLEFQAEKRTYVPHAFDERPLLAFASAHRFPQRRAGPIRLFAPARQDWVLGDPTRSKANHLIVEAAAELVAVGEKNFEIVFVNWGDDVAATKELIRMRDVEARFSWIDPLARNALWMRYLDSDAILDQFLISGLSGVTYEALTLGCRIITKDDGICNKEFFGVPPPFLAASSSKEVAERIQQLIADPDDLSGIGSASQEWARQYHSSARFIALQEAQFERVAEMTARTRDSFQSRSPNAVPPNLFARLLSRLQSVGSSLEASLRGRPSSVRRLDGQQDYNARHDKNDN